MICKNIASINSDNYEFKNVVVYDEELHIAMLDEVFSSGGLPIDFCMKANISKDTLNEWLETYPNFKNAYDILIIRTEVIWMHNEEMARTSFRYWYLIMQNVFGFDNVNLMADYQKITAKQLSDKVLEGICEGRFTDMQIGMLNDIINQRLKVEQNDVDEDVLNIKRSVDKILNEELSYKTKDIKQATQEIELGYDKRIKGYCNER